jgi:ATP-dependent exoDNAse (exonuclease V) beta subunit
LALVRGTNLFIVGDRKQSIYGFRGADVDVFTEMTAAIENAGGLKQPLHLNFRSQKPLIDSLNFIFAKIFEPRVEVPQDALDQLGYVAHELSIAQRDVEHDPPHVEFLVGVVPDETAPAENAEPAFRSSSFAAQERDAEQIATRISALVSDNEEGRPEACVPNYKDIAILLRAFTGVWTYESALRRAGIPYLTVQGKGFYQREEITDLIQLLRFLDNTTDELALAAILRSPLGGISDNALLALRCAPWVDGDKTSTKLHRRNLLRAVRRHREISFIDQDDQTALDRIAVWIESMIDRRNRYGIADLLRHAVASSEFMPIIAANFDGAQRVANVEKLFRLAEQFEKSGHLIRDFVHYVEEFEAIGGREGEGQMDETANVVRLMTIHQAKGLEFPVVIIPDLHREPNRREAAFILDRHKGMTVRVPDGRGRSVRGALFNEMGQRNRWREEFESMRLLYVAATRAEDLLILSGAIDRKGLENLTKTDREQWLGWVWRALELEPHAASELLKLSDEVQIQITIDREPQTPFSLNSQHARSESPETLDLAQPLEETFPLLQPIKAEDGKALRRFTVTQLINFQRCARQYYFERMLRTPGKEERAVWNDAEAPEPPANLTATLKGAVIHRFCETFREGDNIEGRLTASFEDVLSQRQAELIGRTFQINKEEAVRTLLPLAENYLASDVFRRIVTAQGFADSAFQIPNSKFQIRNGQSAIRNGQSAIRNAQSAIRNPQSAVRNPQSAPGLWSELRFRLRRPNGILTGTIDKLLITPATDGEGVDVEIIDFKTNRFSVPARRFQTDVVTAEASGATQVKIQAKNSTNAIGQGLLNFESIAEEVVTEDIASPDNELLNASINDQVERVANDYRLQMQGYAVALRELLPADVRIQTLRATLHFIEPQIEFSLAASLLEEVTCARNVDEAMRMIALIEGTLDADQFPPLPAAHCRTCNFLEMCPAGKEWMGRWPPEERVALA